MSAFFHALLVTLLSFAGGDGGKADTGQYKQTSFCARPKATAATLTENKFRFLTPRFPSTRMTDKGILLKRNLEEDIEFCAGSFCISCM